MTHLYRLNDIRSHQPLAVEGSVCDRMLDLPPSQMYFIYIGKDKHFMYNIFLPAILKRQKKKGS